MGGMLKGSPGGPKGAAIGMAAATIISFGAEIPGIVQAFNDEMPDFVTQMQAGRLASQCRVFAPMYRQVTISLNHGGVRLRGVKPGAEIGTKRQYLTRAGDFILSRIDARNAAFGIVPDSLDGAVITNDFWSFEIDRDQVDLDYFYLLSQTDAFLDNNAHVVTVLEAAGRPGGHAHTVEVHEDDSVIAIDTGFIVFNFEHYPLLSALFDSLGIRSQPSDMSFSVRCDESGFEFNGSNIALEH